MVYTQHQKEKNHELKATYAWKACGPQDILPTN